MKDFLLCALLLACLAVLVGLPVLLAVAAVNREVGSMLAQNMGILKAAFVAWFVSIVIVSTAGNK